MCIYSKAFVFKHIGKQLDILVSCNLRLSRSLNTFYFKMDG